MAAEVGQQRREQVGAVGLAARARCLSAALAISPSRSRPRSRGLPRPATSRPSARPMSGSARSASRTRSRRSGSSWSHCTSASRASIARRVGQRRRQVGGEQPPARRGDAAVDRREQAAGDGRRSASRQISRLSRVAGVDRHVRCRARSGAARRGRRPRPSACIEIGEQPARRGQLGAAGQPKPSSVATPKRAFSARSPSRLSNPPLPGGRGDARHLVRRRSSRPATSRASSDFKLARAARDQLEPAGRNVGGGDRPFVAGARDRGEPVGRAAVEQASPRSACPA